MHLRCRSHARRPRSVVHRHPCGWHLHCACRRERRHALDEGGGTESSGRSRRNHRASGAKCQQCLGVRRGEARSRRLLGGNRSIGRAHRQELLPEAGLQDKGNEQRERSLSACTALAACSCTHPRGELLVNAGEELHLHLCKLLLYHCQLVLALHRSPEDLLLEGRQGRE